MKGSGSGFKGSMGGICELLILSIVSRVFLPPQKSTFLNRTRATSLSAHTAVTCYPYKDVYIFSAGGDLNI
jgi:ABC-type amino acid transport system permease subunit